MTSLPAPAPARNGRRPAARRKPAAPSSQPTEPAVPHLETAADELRLAKRFIDRLIDTAGPEIVTMLADEIHAAVNRLETVADPVCQIRSC